MSLTLDGVAAEIFARAVAPKLPGLNELEVERVAEASFMAADVFRKIHEELRLKTLAELKAKEQPR